MGPPAKNKRKRTAGKKGGPTSKKEEKEETNRKVPVDPFEKLPQVTFSQMADYLSVEDMYIVAAVSKTSNKAVQKLNWTCQSVDETSPSNEEPSDDDVDEEERTEVADKATVTHSSCNRKLFVTNLSNNGKRAGSCYFCHTRHCGKCLHDVTPECCYCGHTREETIEVCGPCKSKGRFDESKFIKCWECKSLFCRANDCFDGDGCYGKDCPITVCMDCIDRAGEEPGYGCGVCNARYCSNCNDKYVVDHYVSGCKAKHKNYFDSSSSSSSSDDGDSSDNDTNTRICREHLKTCHGGCGAELCDKCPRSSQCPRCDSWSFNCELNQPTCGCRIPQKRRWFQVEPLTCVTCCGQKIGNT